MQNFQAIDLRQPRDFSRKMNATFEFLRQNFKQLSKSILFIAGPPILLASVLMGTFVGDAFSVSALSPGGFGDSYMSPSFWMQLILVMVFFLVSTISTIATINSYIVLYSEKKTNQIEVSEVWERVRSTFWMYLGTTLMFTVLSIVVYIVLAIPVVILTAITPVLVFFAVLACFFVVIWLFISASLVFIIRAFEDVGFMEAVARSFRLVRGKWWSTFGLIVLLYLIVMFVSYFIILGWSMITLATALHDVDSASVAEKGQTLQIFTVVFFSFYYLLQMVLYSLPNVGIAFQYFNLVERKEAKNLINQIDNIGQTPTSPAHGPDEQY
jgi:hypothetical protein